jgi:ribosomal protein S18 acetylase RimI-like enzyme
MKKFDQESPSRESEESPGEQQEQREITAESEKRDHSIIEEIERLRELVIREKGEEGARLAALYLEGKITGEEMESDIEPIPDREELVEDALRRLEKIGIVDWVENPETHNRSIVVDIEALKALPRQAVRRLGPIANHPAYGQKKKHVTLYEIFRSQSVITKEQLEQNDFKERPLFYVPQNAAAALSPDEIKKTDFQMGVWEVMGGTTTKAIPYPVKEGSASDVQETRLATLLFHPKYGDGYRDEGGDFWIRDKKTREYKKLSGRMLETYGLSTVSWITEERRKDKSRPTTRSLRQSVRDLFPNLISRDLIRPEDFGIASTGQHTEKERVVRTTVSPDGYVMFNAVKHYLGREFYGKPIRIYQLSEDMGGLVTVANDGTETLSHTFRIFSKDNVRKTGKGYPIAGQSLTEIQAFTPENVSLPKRADENEKAYENRLASLEGFGFLLKVSNDLASLGVYLQKENIYTQMIVARSAKAFVDQQSYDRFLKFAKTFGKDGVRTFLATGYDISFGDKIVALGERLPPESTTLILKKYCEIADTAERTTDYLAKNIKTDTVKPRLPEEAIYDQLMRQGKELLSRYITEEEDKTLNQISEALTVIKSDILLFAATFKIASKENNISLEDIRDTEITVAESNSLEQKDRDTMISIFRRNREAHSPELFKAELGEFKTALEKPDVRFYILRNKEEIIAFVRFEDLENGNAYAGSFNVDPTAQRSTIGRAFLHSAINQENETRTIEASVDAENSELIGFYQKEFLLNPVGEEMFGGHKYLKLFREHQTHLAKTAGSKRAAA